MSNLILGKFVLVNLNYSTLPDYSCGGLRSIPKKSCQIFLDGLCLTGGITATIWKGCPTTLHDLMQRTAGKGGMSWLEANSDFCLC